MREGIPIKVKRECLRLKNEGVPVRVIYEDYFTKTIDHPCSYTSFQRAMGRWSHMVFPDDTTLQFGTYEGFTAHNATVQVSKTGEIVQAWIKQRPDEFDPEDFLNAIHGKIEPYEYEPKYDKKADRMLEIPLFDMHWGVSFLNHYEPVLRDILAIIHSRHWNEIVIPVGQDFFHNDSIVNPTTTKGTVIDKVDMTRAVKEGRKFITTIIDTALVHANHVQVLYSAGNHDRSISWMLCRYYLNDMVLIS